MPEEQDCLCDLGCHLVDTALCFPKLSAVDYEFGVRYKETFSKVVAEQILAVFRVWSIYHKN